MKVFWAIIAVLVVATCVLLVRRGGPAATSPSAPSPVQAPAATPSESPSVTPSTGRTPAAPTPMPSLPSGLPEAAVQSPSASERTPARPEADEAAEQAGLAERDRLAAEQVPAVAVESALPTSAEVAGVGNVDAGEAAIVETEEGAGSSAGSGEIAAIFDGMDDVDAGREAAPTVVDNELSGTVARGGLLQVTTEMADDALGDLPDLDELLADSLGGLDPDLADALLAERDAAAEALAMAAAERNNADGDLGDGSGGMPDHSMEMLINPAAAQAALAARREQEALVLSEEQAVRDAAPVSREADGTLLFAGRYRVPGAGTAANPYKISWELLTSVRRSYDPSAGRNDLPAWLEELNGKHVQLSGFVLFPVMAEASDELLLMYNQWDGCCIGIPPTPYDAIEVRLKAAPRSVPRWAVNYGTLSGRFDVDPYIVSNWLLGLYLMDAAELDLAGL